MKFTGHGFVGDGKLERLSTSQFKVIAITNCNDVPTAEKLMAADIVLCSSRLFESGPYQNKVFQTEVNAELSMNQACMQHDDDFVDGGAASSSSNGGSKRKKASKASKNVAAGKQLPSQRATDKDGVYLEILSRKVDELARRSSSSSSSSVSATSSFLMSFGKKRAREENDDIMGAGAASASRRKSSASSSSSSSSSSGSAYSGHGAAASSSSSSHPALHDSSTQRQQTNAKAQARFGRELLPLECFYWRRIVLDEVGFKSTHPINSP